MAAITEDYVSYEVAKLLKEKGFNEYCPESYFMMDKTLKKSGFSEWEKVNEIKAPTQSRAMKWLREVHNIDIVIDAAVGMLGVKVYVPLISTYKPLKDAPSKVHQIKRGIYYKDDKGAIPALQYSDSYEEAVETTIKYCLENLI